MDKNLLKEFIDATVLDQDKAAAMLKQNGALLNARYIHNETVLHFLCVEDYIEGVKSLLENGAEVDATNEFGDVALLDAVSIGRTEIVKLLLQFGADANAVSATRGHVLHLAAETGNHEIFEALLQHGARTDYVDDLGKSLADCITQKQSKRAKIIKVLEKHQASR